MELPLSYSIEEKDDGKWLCAKVGNRLWTDLHAIGLYGDIAKSLLAGSFRNICYDLSEVGTVSSRLFGIFFNIINKAERCKKKVKFRLNKDAMETATIANLHRRITIEVV